MFEGLIEVMDKASQLGVVNFALLIALVATVALMWRWHYAAKDEERGDELVRSQLELIRDTLTMTDHVNETFQKTTNRITDRIDSLIGHVDVLVIQLNKLEQVTNANVRAIASTREGINELKDIIVDLHAAGLKRDNMISDTTLNAINTTALGAVRTTLKHNENAINDLSAQLIEMLNSMKEDTSGALVSVTEIGQLLGTIMRAVESSNQTHLRTHQQIESLQLLMRVNNQKIALVNNEPDEAGDDEV